MKPLFFMVALVAMCGVACGPSESPPESEQGSTAATPGLEPQGGCTAYDCNVLQCGDCGGGKCTATGVCKCNAPCQ